MVFEGTVCCLSCCLVSAAIDTGVGIRSGNSSLKRILKDGRDRVLMNFGDDCLSRDGTSPRVRFGEGELLAAGENGGVV